MKAAPRLLSVMLATLAAAGCRTGEPRSIAHNRPPVVEPRTAFQLQEFITEHNQNARRIQSLEARPSIGVKIGPPGKENGGGVDGRLALERPRNFKLELSHYRSTIADIGSNDERFWFWFQNKKDKSVYVCNYDELNSTSLAVTYQPDWIAEALGLKTITREEAAQIKVRPGLQPDTTALIFPVVRSGGQPYSRIMIVSDETLRMKELRVYAPDGKTMIAQATIQKYKDVPAHPEAEDNDSTASAETCLIPESIVLEWKREQISLDVSLKDVKLNQFDPARRTALFVEPHPSGYARVNLAEVARQKEPSSATAIRESMPVPDLKEQVRLSPPMEIREEPPLEDAPRRRKPKTDRESSPAATLLPVGGGLEEVVGAPVPSAPSSFPDRAVSSSALIDSPGTSLAR
jgi:hypothetical protein